MNNQFTKKKKITFAFDLILFFVLIWLDQLTKQLAVSKLKDKPSFPIIDGFLELNYLENRGAAFGMLQNQKFFFIFVSFIVLVAIGYILWKIPEHKKYRWLHISLVAIAAGAVGNNLFDRFSLDYVRDFIYLVIINFPIFNLADIYVCIATFILVVLLLFVYKEEDLSFLSFKEKKYRQIKE